MQLNPSAVRSARVLEMGLAAGGGAGWGAKIAVGVMGLCRREGGVPRRGAVKWQSWGHVGHEEGWPRRRTGGPCMAALRYCTDPCLRKTLLCHSSVGE